MFATQSSDFQVGSYSLKPWGKGLILKVESLQMKSGKRALASACVLYELYGLI